MKIPILTTDQARELDKRAQDEFDIPSLLLMEYAGRGLADHVMSLLAPLPHFAQVAILCGGGNNGGDGFVLARYLHQSNHNATVFLFTDPDSLKGDALTNYKIIHKLGVSITTYDRFTQVLESSFRNKPLIIVDAILGTGFKGAPRENVKNAIHQINDIKLHHTAKVSVVAVDIPSGLDGNKGPVHNDAVKADLTLTFACRKQGLMAPESKPFVGKLVIIDIGIPEKLMKSYNNA